jgi:hypothetical protein
MERKMATPWNPNKHFPQNVQMHLLRADLRTVRSQRGPLRKNPLIRAHFWNRLVDAKSAA